MAKAKTGRNNKGQFLPGAVANPAGRPKKEWSWKSILEKIGEEEIEVKGMGKMQKREAIIRLVYKAASEGEPWAIQTIMDRTEGKPIAKVEEVTEMTIHVTHEIIPCKRMEEAKPVEITLPNGD